VSQLMALSAQEAEEISVGLGHGCLSMRIIGICAIIYQMGSSQSLVGPVQYGWDRF
jgi:hypothetical protein